MSAFYEGLAATAMRLIKEKGQVVSVSLKIPGEYDVNTSSTLPDEEDVVLTSGLVGSFSARDIGNVPGDKQEEKFIQQTDIKLTVPAAGFARPPSSTDRVTIAGKIYRVVNTVVLAPAETHLIYTLQLRK